MHFSITYAGVDAHIAGIREELRNVETLREQLRRLYRQADVLFLDAASLRRCAEEVRIVEESIRRRMDFLDLLVSDAQRLNVEIGDIINAMRIQEEDNGP